MTRQEAAIDLTKRAAVYLFANHPETVVGGCRTVAASIAAFLDHLGYRVKVVYGLGADYAFRIEPAAEPHAWLVVEDLDLDPTWWVTGNVASISPVQVHPDDDRLSSIQRRRIGQRIVCDLDLANVYAEELVTAFEKKRLRSSRRPSSREIQRLLRRRRGRM